VFLTYHHYKSTSEEEKRMELARKNWEKFKWTTIPFYLNKNKRSSKLLGDTRRCLPFLKDIIGEAIAKINNDNYILVYTNSDLLFTIEAEDKIREKIENIGFCFNRRVDLAEVTTIKKSTELIKCKSIAEVDMFGFKIAWWKKYLNHIPDFVIGCEAWDHVISSIMRLLNYKSEIEEKITYHKKHRSFWRKTDNQSNKAQQYNLRLARKWLLNHKLPIYFDGQTNAKKAIDQILLRKLKLI